MPRRVIGRCRDAGEEAAIGRRPLIRIAIMKMSGDLLCRVHRSQPDPDCRLSGWKMPKERARCRHGHLCQRFPGVVAIPIDLEDEGRGICRGMGDGQLPMVIPREEKRFADGPGWKVLPQPDGTAAEGRPEPIESLWLDEPEIRV